MNTQANPAAPLQTVVEYDDGLISIDIAKIPHGSLLSLVRKGVAHYFGNEQASKVSTAKAKSLEASKDAEGNVIPGRELTDGEIAELKAGFRAEAMKALLEGTMGASLRGPSKDPFEAALDSIVRESVKETLRKYGLKVPKADGVVTFADGTTRTMEQMIENRLAKEGEALRRAATKKVADDKKKADAIRAAAAANSGKLVNFEDLGL